MFGLIKQVLIGLLCFSKCLSSIANTADLMKCLSLNNQQCKTQPTFINLHANNYIEGLHYYSFPVNLDRCVGNCIILINLSNKVCVPKEKEDLSLSVFNMITGINESKILAKHISCKCKCKFDGRKCNLNQDWDNDKCQCKYKNPKEYNACKKDYIWNLINVVVKILNI